MYADFTLFFRAVPISDSLPFFPVLPELCGVGIKAPHKASDLLVLYLIQGVLSSIRVLYKTKYKNKRPDVTPGCRAGREGINYMVGSVMGKKENALFFETNEFDVLRNIIFFVTNEFIFFPQM